MFTELMASGSGGGGGGMQFTLVESAYTTSGYRFYFTVIDSAEGKYHYFNEASSMSTGGDEHVYNGLKLQKTANGTWKFTATDDYCLYEILIHEAVGEPLTNYKEIINHGVNGTKTVSNYYTYTQSFIAVKGDITQGTY